MEYSTETQNSSRIIKNITYRKRKSTKGYSFATLQLIGFLLAILLHAPTPIYTENLLSVPFVELQTDIFENCDHELQIPRDLYFRISASDYIVEENAAAKACRFKIEAPLDHEIKLNCSLKMPNESETSTCNSHLLISRDGLDTFEDAQMYCGEGALSISSNYRHMRLAFVGVPEEMECKVYAVPQACDCGRSITSKIAHGEEADAHEFPGLVAITSKSNPTHVDCGGAIISHRYIFTAGHCIEGHTEDDLLVHVGLHYINSTATNPDYVYQHEVESIIPHPDYHQALMPTNDLALLKTATNIEWSRAVAPLCLPSLDMASHTFTDEMVSLMGWGSHSFFSENSPVLLKLQLSIISNADCQTFYDDVALNDTQICTQDLTEQFKDTCNGDSGGPLIWQHAERQFVIGCISFGKICAREALATAVNTRLTSFLEWIAENTLEPSGSCGVQFLAAS